MAQVGDFLDPSCPAPITIGGVNATSVTITPNTTVSGTLAVTGVATFAAAPVFSAGQLSQGFTNSALVGATVVLTAAQSGGIFNNRSTSGSPKWTLPAAAAGLKYTFTVSNTTAGVVINCADAATIRAKTSASGTAITSTATTGTIVNTQGTAVVGDVISLACDGTNWFMTSQSGIFAAT